MWNLYNKEEFLKPLCFSNGKTQSDIVKEVLTSIGNGKKIIFIRGVCGTGKSAIALNIARKLGKTSIIVPGKNLQQQYKKDYEGEKYLLKEDGSKLKISVITGRNNHKCKFLEDNANAIPVFKQETDSKLNDIFAGKKEEMENTISDDLSADNYNIPCKVELKEKNWNRIKQYLRQNNKVDPTNYNDLSDVRRVPVASVCPYWSPVLPEKYDLGGPIFEGAKKSTYEGLGGNKFIFYQRRKGCPFYEQFHSYFNSDVIVFNSMKYKLEFAMNRKPLTEVEIVDECDEFLDSFANQRNLNIERLQNSLIHVLTTSEKSDAAISELFELIKYIKQDEKLNASLETKEILRLKATGIYDLLKIFLDVPEILNEVDDESYLFEVEEIAKSFQMFMEDTYLTTTKKDGQIIVSLVTTNLAKKFKELVEKNKVVVLMSGTIHSEHVLKNIFGLDEFEILDAEVQNQGQIEVQKTGLEFDCKYSNFNSGNFSREDYLRSLDKCLEVAKKPALVHVNAFLDLPSEEEINDFNLKNLTSREKVREMQRDDSEGKIVSDFKKGDFDVLFSTRVSRGVDFPGEQCNSIVFTKYPNPNVQDAFWKILQKTKPQHYWDFYRDKATRELWQKVYRGIRFPTDHVFVLSPDVRVLNAFSKKD
ncbi:DEAD/DEAH box helicase family protein [archaeon]|jgi:Rad3-related DNA helicase|nr:DEAD/DEAH box helicase family protein [archaeon]